VPDPAETPDETPVVRLVDLRETPLDVGEVLAALGDEASGGLTLFVGRVRDHDHGLGVRGLEYTAHPTALDALRRVCDRVAEEYDVHGVAAVHRVGVLEIGDIAVVVATSAAHRGEAFAGAREIIDAIKARAPIWKTEEGEWVEGAPPPTP
jgi:molybdopterin synthase catalytic subunit